MPVRRARQLIEFFLKLTSLKRRLSCPKPVDEEELPDCSPDRTDNKAQRIYQEVKRYTLRKEECLAANKYDCHLLIHYI